MVGYLTIVALVLCRSSGREHGKELSGARGLLSPHPPTPPAPTIISFLLNHTAEPLKMFNAN